MAQEYLTIKEYAEKTRIAENTLRKNFKQGKLPNATKIGGSIRIVEYVNDEFSEALKEQQEAITSAIRHIADGYNELLGILENM